LQACWLFGAKLVIAKLDRLSRDAHFLLGLEKAGVDFVAADMPQANRLTVRIMAMVADEERRAISARAKAALAAAKRRGTELGGYRGGKGLPKPLYELAGRHVAPISRRSFPNCAQPALRAWARLGARTHSTRCADCPR
jgi:DNA invertase Pin-like site-specific DNA recombinase